MQLIPPHVPPAPAKPKRWIEARRRGLFGRLVLAVFWVWNLFCVAWLGVYVVDLAGHYAKLTSEAARTGHAAGAAIGVFMLFGMWGAGAVVLGLAAHFTRGPRELIEVEG